MPASVLQPDSSLSLVLDEVVFTPAILAANPLTEALAAEFDPVTTTWTVVNNQEIQLRIAIVKGNALVAAADAALDDLADALSRTVLLLVKGDRSAAQYVLYFAKPPNELKRPVLGGQLETMRGWVKPLVESENADLKKLGEKLTVAIAKADAAVTALNAAEQANRTFRTVGERRALIDSANAVRKSTYGKLSEMPHANPELLLPAAFAEGFFKHETRKSPVKLTSAALKAQIADLEEELAAKKAQLATILAEEEAAAKALAAADEHAAAVAAAEKEAEAAAAKVLALKAKKK